MHTVAFLLACLAFASHGCSRRMMRERLQAACEKRQSSQKEDCGSASAGVFAQFLRARAPGIGWQVAYGGHGHGMSMRNHHANHGDSSFAILMAEGDRASKDFLQKESLSEFSGSLAARTSNRREALKAGAALGGLLLPNALATPALADARESLEGLAEGDAVEYTVPMAQLTAALATAPPRDVVITGCNSGVGLAGAKILTAAGHRVICACRTQAKADAAAAACNTYAAAATGSARKGGVARGAECNLASLSSVRDFAKSLEGANVDTLVLNAGLSKNVQDFEISRTLDGFEETIGVNHLGHFLLANLLVPKLAAKPKARIVITASPVHDPLSGGGKQGRPATLGDLAGLAGGAGFEMVDGQKFDPDKAYKDSKLCNVMFMAEAARRFAAKDITVNAFSPGLIADPEGFFRNQNKLFANVFNTISKVVGVAESNEFGGSALAYLSVDPAVDSSSGKWFDSYPSGKHQLAVHMTSSEARRVESQTNLWAFSSKLVGLNA